MYDVPAVVRTVRERRRIDRPSGLGLRGMEDHAEALSTFGKTFPHGVSRISQRARTRARHSALRRGQGPRRGLAPATSTPGRCFDDSSGGRCERALAAGNALAISTTHSEPRRAAAQRRDPSTATPLDRAVAAAERRARRLPPEEARPAHPRTRAPTRLSLQAPPNLECFVNRLLVGPRFERRSSEPKRLRGFGVARPPPLGPRHDSHHDQNHAPQQLQAHFSTARRRPPGPRAAPFAWLWCGETQSTVTMRSLLAKKRRTKARSSS